MNRKPQIPDFNIVEQCGQGGSSTVWLAIDYDGIRRAIRILDRITPRNQGRVEAEAKAISLYRNVANRHENLLDILYIGKTEEYLYYVTELADDTGDIQSKYQPDTLAWRIRNKNYSKSEMLDYIEAILDGVEQLHSNRLAHHDLKPENILFLHHRLKIGDPGLSAPIPEHVHGGTSGFLPPWPEPNGIESDIYAIGKIIYCLYSKMDATEFPEIPIDLKIKAVADLNRIALKCCEESPEFRYHSIAEIRKDVRALRQLPAWKKVLHSVNAYLSPVLGFFLLLMLILYFTPVVKKHLQRIPLENGRELFLNLKHSIGNWNLLETFQELERLKERSPELAREPEFCEFYSQLADHAEWLQVYRSSGGTQFMLPNLILELDLFDQPEQKEGVVQRYILLNEEIGRRPAAMVLYYRFARQNGKHEKADRILQMLKDFDVSGLNRITVAIGYVRLALYLCHEKKYDDALLFSLRAEKLAPYFYGVYIVLFQVYYLREDYPNAERAMRKLYKLQPENVLLPKLYALLSEKGFDATF